MIKAQSVVVDSSVIVKWVNTQNEKYLSQANSILEDAREDKIQLFTSEVAKYEVANALLTKKGLSLPQAHVSLGTVYSLPITFVQETLASAESTYKIGQEFDITYYDAAFISVAKQLNATLVTDNPKHQGRTREVKVVSLKDYK